MMLYPTPKNHCLNCFHCKRIIQQPNVPVGSIVLTEDNARQESAPIRCEFRYWGELPDGREKIYRSPWVAAKSKKLAEIAQRCPEYDDNE